MAQQGRSPATPGRTAHPFIDLHWPDQETEAQPGPKSHSECGVFLRFCGQWPFPTYRWEWNRHPSGPGVSPDQKGTGLGPQASPTPIPACFMWRPPPPAGPSLTRNTGRTSRPQPAQATAPAPFPTTSCPLTTARVSGDPDPGVPATQCQESPQRRKGAWGCPSLTPTPPTLLRF